MGCKQRAPQHTHAQSLPWRRTRSTVDSDGEKMLAKVLDALSEPLRDTQFNSHAISHRVYPPPTSAYALIPPPKPLFGEPKSTTPLDTPYPLPQTNTSSYSNPSVASMHSQGTRSNTHVGPPFSTSVSSDLSSGSFTIGFD